MSASRAALFLIIATSAAAGCDSSSGDPAPDEVAATSTEEPPPTTTTEPPPKMVRVDRVLDGDTIDLRSGKRVRLVQIDAPESSGECYGQQAGRVLRGILPSGTRILLQADPRLDKVDRYGRLLRYVFKGRENVNLALVRRGAASVWFFDGDRGRYAAQLLTSARNARANDRGAWGACRAKLDPNNAFTTETVTVTTTELPPTTTVEPQCMDGYSPCLPITGDLDCDDVRALGKAPVQVTGSDPYRLDGDGDGFGCE